MNETRYQQLRVETAESIEDLRKRATELRKQAELCDRVADLGDTLLKVTVR